MFDHHSRNKGWGICQQKLPNAGQTVEQFFQMLGVCQKGGGGCSWLELTRTLRALSQVIASNTLLSLIFMRRNFCNFCDLKKFVKLKLRLHFNKI